MEKLCSWPTPNKTSSDYRRINGEKMVTLTADLQRANLDHITDSGPADLKAADIFYKVAQKKKLCNKTERREQDFIL